MDTYTESDLENISLASTEVSDQDADKEYEVDKILASKQVDSGDRYLVLWKGYPIARSTWEPLESFNDPNTVFEWKKTAARQKSGLEPEFDWPAWDKKREEDEFNACQRRNKREYKRRLHGWTRREIYGGSPGLDGFVIEDDEASDLEPHVDSSSDSQLDYSEKKIRKRKKVSTPDENSDGYESDDSTHRRQLRVKRYMQSRQSGNNSGEDSPSRSPKASIPDKKENQVRLEKRKRAQSPSETLSGAAKNLSLGPENRRRGDKDRQMKKQKLQSGVKIMARPQRPGPSKIKQRYFSTTTAPGQVKTFTSLSHVNRVYKAGKNEPPPDLSKIELFAPGHPGRALPPIIPQSRRASLPQSLRAFPEALPAPGNSVDRPPSPVKVNKSVPYANFRIPKRKSTSSIPAPGSVQPLSASTHEGKNSAIDSDILHRRGSDVTRRVSSDYRSPVSYDAMDIENTLGGKPWVMSPSRLMDVDYPRFSDPRFFICQLELGPQANLVGEAKFTGFPATFVEELYRKPECRELWISKFYSQYYLIEYFAPHYGIPLHVGAIEIDPEQVQPLINALSFLKGAGVVLHEDFTMLVYLPSNTYLDRQAFKLSQLPIIGPNKVKPALRVVVYPPLESVPISSKESPYKVQEKYPVAAMDRLPWWEKDLEFSLPAYVASSTGCNWDEVLETEREKMERDAGKERRETLFVLLYPPIAEAESKEYKHCLECLNRNVVDLDHVQKNVKAGGGLDRYSFLIHQSLRRQLHLFPDIVPNRKKEARSYWLYGTKLDQQIIDEKPQRIWSSGSVIFITPQLIVSNPDAFKDFVNYAERKAATTKLALPSVWNEKVMEVMHSQPSEEVLIHIYDIKQKLAQNSIILIPVDLHQNCDELDIYIDEFALYQLDNPTQFRRYWLGHPTLPDAGTVELFKSIEFFTPESIKAMLKEELKRVQRDQESRNKHTHPIRRGSHQLPERRL